MSDRSEERPLPAIRPMTAEDIPAVAVLHRALLKDSLFAEIGRVFLETVYRALLPLPSSFGHVAEGEEGLEGFVFSTADTEEAERGLGQATPSLIASSLPRFLRRPAVAWDILKMRGVGAKIRAIPPDPGTELYTIAVRPIWRGRGVGAELFRAAREEFRARGCAGFALTVAKGNRTACSFYNRQGMTVAGEFRSKGIDMLKYVMLLDATP